jgi:hypothetical protein
MDHPAPHIPLPSLAWSHLAESLNPELPPTAPTTPLEAEDATMLRARLLRMIVNKEQARRAAADPFNLH